MQIFSALFGVTVFLFLSAFGVSALRRARRLRERRRIRELFEDSDPELRKGAVSWLNDQQDSEAFEIARELLQCEVLQVQLEVSLLIVKRFNRYDDRALEALARVATSGSPEQRQQALWALRGIGPKDPAIVDVLAQGLPSEPDWRLRLDLLLILVEIGKRENSKVSSEQRARIVRAVARRLEETSREVRFAARVALQAGGPLAFAVVEAETALMEMLRSPQQDTVDAVASVILDNRESLRAAVSCIPASKASSMYLKAIL